MTSDESRYQGILLAGGQGSRLYPTTRASTKQLLAVFDKPMVYYPLSTLMLAGVRRILIISTLQDLPRYERLLGDGSQWGLELAYASQDRPAGIADALIIGEDFIGGDPVILTLGDNIIFGRFDFLRRALGLGPDHALIFAYEVEHPSDYGVVEFGADGMVVSLEEKPAEPKSRWAVPGLYLYPRGVAAEARDLAPSARGELEITDLNRRYLERGMLRAVKMGRGTAWFDTGTSNDLLEAANFIQALQHRQGLIIGSPEEAAFRMGFIGHEDLVRLIEAMPNCSYRVYLERVVREL